MIVVKLGGAKGNAAGPVLDELADRDGEHLLVHGASAATDHLQRRLGQEPRHATSPSGHEYRVTDDDAIEALTMAAAWRNRRIVAGLRRRGADAVGLSGVDAGVVARRKQGVRAQVEGRTIVVRDRSGIIEDLDPIPVAAVLDAGRVPVLTLPAATREGEMLNVDADRIAARFAAELDAEALVLLTAVPGLLEDPDDATSRIDRLARSDLDDATDDVAQGRFKRKLVAAREALDGGVPRVVIGPSERDDPIGGALSGDGTVIA